MPRVIVVKAFAPGESVKLRFSLHTHKMVKPRKVHSCSALNVFILSKITEQPSKPSALSINNLFAMTDGKYRHYRSLGWSSRHTASGLRILQVLVVASAFLILLQAAYNGHSKVLRGIDTTRILETERSSSSTASEWGSQNPRSLASPLSIPVGEAKALPSIRVENVQDVERGIYGGKGDKKHLGGFTAYDGQGVSPSVWKHMISDLGVKTLMDVGCGKVGTSEMTISCL